MEVLYMNPQEIISASSNPSWEKNISEEKEKKKTPKMRFKVKGFKNKGTKEKEAANEEKGVDNERNNNEVKGRRQGQYEEVDCETQEMALEFSDWDDYDEDGSGGAVTYACIASPDPVVPTYSKVHKIGNEKQFGRPVRVTYADIETETLAVEKKEKKAKKRAMRKCRSTEMLDDPEMNKGERNSILLALSKPFQSLRAIGPKSPRISVMRLFSRPAPPVPQQVPQQDYDDGELEDHYDISGISDQEFDDESAGNSDFDVFDDDDDIEDEPLYESIDDSSLNPRCPPIKVQRSSQAEEEDSDSSSPDEYLEPETMTNGTNVARASSFSNRECPPPPPSRNAPAAPTPIAQGRAPPPLPSPRDGPPPEVSRPNLPPARGAPAPPPSRSAAPPPALPPGRGPAPPPARSTPALPPSRQSVPVAPDQELYGEVDDDEEEEDQENYEVPEGPEENYEEPNNNNQAHTQGKGHQEEIYDQADEEEEFEQIEYEEVPTNDKPPARKSLPAPPPPTVQVHEECEYQAVDEHVDENHSRRPPAPIPAPQQDVYEDPEAGMPRPPAGRVSQPPPPGRQLPALPPPRHSDPPEEVYEPLPEDEEEEYEQTEAPPAPPPLPAIPSLPPPRSNPVVVKKAQVPGSGPNIPTLNFGDGTIKEQMKKLRPTANKQVFIPEKKPQEPQQMDFRANLKKSGNKSSPAPAPAPVNQTPAPPISSAPKKKWSIPSASASPATQQAAPTIPKWQQKPQGQVDRVSVGSSGSDSGSGIFCPPVPQRIEDDEEDDLPPPPPELMSPPCTSIPDMSPPPIPGSHAPNMQIKGNSKPKEGIPSPLRPVTPPLSSIPDMPPPPPPSRSIQGSQLRKTPLPMPKTPDTPTFSSIPEMPPPPIPASAAAHAAGLGALPPVPVQENLEDLYSFPWYFSTIERKVAEEKLRNLQAETIADLLAANYVHRLCKGSCPHSLCTYNVVSSQKGKDGSFIVRKSSKGGPDNPYTLTLFYKYQMFHLHIRLRPDKKYALGKEKPGEQAFFGVAELIQYHQRTELILTPANARSNGGTTILKQWPPK